MVGGVGPHRAARREGAAVVVTTTTKAWWGEPTERSASPGRNAPSLRSSLSAVRWPLGRAPSPCWPPPCACCPCPGLLDTWRQGLVVLAVEALLGVVGLIAPGPGRRPRGGCGPWPVAWRRPAWPSWAWPGRRGCSAATTSRSPRGVAAGAVSRGAIGLRRRVHRPRTVGDHLANACGCRPARSSPPRPPCSVSSRSTPCGPSS